MKDQEQSTDVTLSEVHSNIVISTSGKETELYSLQK